VLQRGLGAWPFAEILLQLVELCDQAIGVCHGLELAPSSHQQHSCRVSPGYQLHRGRGHVIEDLLEGARRGDGACQLGHPHRKIDPGVRVR
jgi:hypothetical protein